MLKVHYITKDCILWVQCKKQYTRNVVPEEGIKCRDKQLHPTASVGCNYLSMPLIHASGTTLPTYMSVYRPCIHHDDVIKWKHFPRYWPFVRGIHRSPVNSPHKGQWRGALFSLICAQINGWVNNRKAGDLRRHRAHYDVTVMYMWFLWQKAIMKSFHCQWSNA